MPAIRHSRALPLLTGMVGMTMTEAAGRVWASGLLAPAHGPGLRAEALAVRIFGPRISAKIPTGLPNELATSRTNLIRAPCSS